MTYTKKIFRKATIFPVLLAIGFMATTPLILNVDAEFLPTVPVPEDAILPDITPGVPKHLHVHNQQQGEMLRFTNVWGNIGAGGLEFEPDHLGSAPEEGEITTAFQNLYDQEGNFRYSIEPAWHEVVSEFEFHDIHNHWHIADIGKFSVVAALCDDDPNTPVNSENCPMGDVAQLPSGGDATAVKIGFCISDAYQIAENNPATQKWYWECEVGFQGIQPGWVDQYHQSVEGNEIDITGIDNGYYYLIHEWNPEDRFVDENSENDQSWMLFELNDGANGNQNGNRKVFEIESFAPGCLDDGTTPGLCGELKKNI